MVEKISATLPQEQRNRSLEEPNKDNHHPSKLARTQEPPMSGVQRYLVAIEYDGTNFAGSQKQPTTIRTVQGVLEDAFTKFVGQPVSSMVSSRTDTGVHALMNVFHVDLERISKRNPGEVLPPHEPDVVRKAVNHFLQKAGGDVMIIDVQKVPMDFHARFRAQERTYFYRILSGQDPLSVFEKDKAWHVTDDLDLPKMQEACRILVGHHDFSSFRAAGCQAKSPIKTLDELYVCEMPTWPNFSPCMTGNASAAVERKVSISTTERIVDSDSSVVVERNRENFDATVTEHDNGGILCQNPNGDSLGINGRGFGRKKGHRGYVVVARARSFLYHQVRLLVGTLKSVGTGKISCDDVEKILKARTITSAPPMAPSCGLYLAEVKYDFRCDETEKSNDGNGYQMTTFV